MKIKNAFASLLSLAATLSAAAGTEWTIDGSVYTVDTLYHATVGPGTTETELRVTGPIGTNNLFYATVDVANPYVEMRAAKAGNTMRALETVPQIAERFNRPGENYFIGVNADFFNPSFPYMALGTCVSNGSLTNFRAPDQYRDLDDCYFCVSPDNEPTIARHVTQSYQGSVEFPDGTNYPFYLNKERFESELIIFTPQWQFHNERDGSYSQAGYTGTNQWGTEVAVMPVDDTTMYGSSIKLEVISDTEHFIGNMKIPQGGYVLAGHGNANSYLLALKKGDIVTASIGFKADDKDFAAREVIGGFPLLIVDNKIQSTPGYPEHLAGPEPRTAVGYNADKSKVIMLVVDGRKAGGSAGVNQQMLAKFINCLGCTDAMNFDGGGSSTMYIDRLGVRNVPSTSSIDRDRPEGTPRTVVNALFAVSKAPVDNQVASIEIREKRVDLNTGQSYTPVVYGYNRYGALVDDNLQGFTCRVAPELGTLTGTRLTAGNGNYRGDLTVNYGDASYSIPVYVNGGNGGEANSGIENVIVDSNSTAPVERFNIMGQRLEHPRQGTIVIERQGSTVTKHVVK